MGTRERRERERGEVRTKVLAAARALFAEKGYEAVTMREIADKIEYSPTAIYHHFDNKLSLCTELCASDFVGFGGHFLEAMKVADPIERLREMGVAYVRFAVEHPKHYQFMFLTPMPAMDPMDTILAHPETDSYKMLRLTCQEAIDKGLLRPEYRDAEELAQIMWAQMHGLVSLKLIKGNQPFVGEWRDLEQTARRAMDIIFAGMRAESEVAKSSL